MKIETILNRIIVNDVVSILKEKFRIERMHRFFAIDTSYHFETDDIKLSPSDTIYLKFKGMQESQTYNLLLILGLCNEQNYTLKLQNQIRRVSENNIDKIVIWSISPINQDAVQALKVINTNFIHITSKEIEQVKFISNFFPLGNDYNYAVVINKLTDLIIKRLKKLFHLVLSEIAAPTYDEEYGSHKIGTKAFMAFEESILFKCINKLNWQLRGSESKVAIDVGCGTGRHSIDVLAEHFTKIYGFDFSPKMIEFANLKKRNLNLNHIVFSVADLEYEDIMYEGEYLGKTDLLVAGFGMGSFIEDTSKMLRRFYEWLKPGGILLLTFYNRNSVLLNITPNWRDTSLAAHIDIDSKTLQVELTPQIIFQIYCKPFDNDVKGEISKKFIIDQIYTFPTTMALLPNSLFENELAENLFKKIDRYLSQDKEFSFGHYVVVVAHREPGINEDGYKNVMSMLEINNIEYDIINHDLVLSVEDVRKEIGDHPGCMIKTIIFFDKENSSYISVSLPAEKHIEKNKFAEDLKLSSKKLKFATEKEIVRLGFQIGGIPSFGFPPEHNVCSYIDDELFDQSNRNKVFYMGTGDNRKTLKIKATEFHKIVKDYRRLIF